MTPNNSFYRHELDRNTLDRIYGALKSSGLQPHSVIELNTLYTCRTDTDKNKKKAWYRVGWDNNQHGFKLSFGSFSLGTQSEFFPVYDEGNKQTNVTRKPNPQEEARRKEREKQARRKQENAAIESARIIETTARTARRILDAASANLWPEYLINKRLPLVTPAKGIFGKDLIKLLPKEQEFIKTQIRKVPKFAGRVFGVVPMNRGGKPSNLQILLPEKIEWPDGSRKNKMNLAGAGTKTGAFCLLTADKPLSEYARYIFVEGYAKGLPLLPVIQDDTAVIVVFGVNNYQAIIDSILSDIGGNADGKSFLIAADNGKAGRENAAALLRTYPFLQVTFPEDCEDIDDLFRLHGQTAVKEMLDRAGRTFRKRFMRLGVDKFLAQLKFYVPTKHLLHSGVGTGKTLDLIRRARFIIENGANLVIAMPYDVIVKQTADEMFRAGIPCEAVYSGKAWPGNDVNVILTTYASAAKCPEKYVISLLIVDESHELAGGAFMQESVEAVLRLQGMAVSWYHMTATPYDCQNYAGVIDIIQTAAMKTRLHVHYIDMTRNNREAVVIEAAAAAKAAGKRLIIGSNDKKFNRRCAKTLKALEYSSDFLDSDEKGAGSAYVYALEKKALPSFADVIFGTKLIECGLSLYDTDFADIIIFDLHATMTPQEIKQFANRFRKVKLAVHLYLSKEKKNDCQIDWNSEEVELSIIRRTQALLKGVKQRLATGTENATVTHVEELKILSELATVKKKHEERLKLIEVKDWNARILRTGVKMAWVLAYRSALSIYGAFRHQEYNKHGLELVSVDDAIITPPVEHADAIARAHAEFADAMQKQFVERLDYYDALQPSDMAKEVQRSKLARKYQELQQHFGEKARKYMEYIGDDDKAFEALKKQIYIAKNPAVFREQRKIARLAIRQPGKNGKVKAVCRMRTAELTNEVKPTFQNSPILKTVFRKGEGLQEYNYIEKPSLFEPTAENAEMMFDDDLQESPTLKMMRYALKWIRQGVEVETIHAKCGNVVKVVSLTPLHSLHQKLFDEPLTRYNVPEFFGVKKSECLQESIYIEKPSLIENIADTIADQDAWYIKTATA